MPHVKLDFSSDEDTVEVLIRPSASMVEKGAREQRWGMAREDESDATDEDLKEWSDTPTGMHDDLLHEVVEVMNALRADPHGYYIRILYDLEPDGEDPAVEPEPLRTPRLVAAVQALLNRDGVSYR